MPCGGPPVLLDSLAGTVQASKVGLYRLARDTCAGALAGVMPLSPLHLPVARR